MTDMAPSDLTSLLGSRICHDLISPLGAIGNGLELLEMTGGGVGPEMDLISQSVRNANARIRFFRVAFGTAGQGQTVSKAELGSILEESYAGGRIGLSHDLGPDISRRDARAALLVMLCVESALPRGGSVSVAGGTGTWAITAQSPHISFDPAMWSGAANADGLRAAEVQFALLPDAMRQAHRSLSVNHGDGMLTLRF